eukprot:PhF_6_TR11760/c0_g1_i7/m.19270
MILLLSIFFLFTEITSSFPNAPEVYPNGRPNVSVIRPFTDTTQIARFTESRRWAVIPFLKPLGLKESTFIIPPINGLTARRLMLWGIRARIQVQYSNGSNVANPNINPSCVYLGVDEDKATIPINTSLWYFNSYDMERPSHILFRCQIVDDNIPDHFFDWVMNVSVFVNVVRYPSENTNTILEWLKRCGSEHSRRQRQFGPLIRTTWNSRRISLTD